MRNAVQYIVSKTYKPALTRYLSKTRNYSLAGIELEISPGIFHPGFFFSTKLLLNHIRKKDLHNKAVLELGAGSGLLSIYAAKQGAEVFASDISPEAIACLARNRNRNNVSFEIIQSDLFDRITKRKIDLILINPPYYKKKPGSYKEYAWYCGENGEYFQKLFSQLNEYIHDSTEILMVLCDGCDLQMIRGFASANRFEMVCVQAVNKLIEDNYVFKIERAAKGSSSVNEAVTQEFEKIYGELRASEKRLYTDEEVMNLPEIVSSHPHKEEWEIRKKSCAQLISHLLKKKRNLAILEIGCGNGWLSHQLARNLWAEVTGIDMHSLELEQAQRVFDHLPNLEFIYGDAAVFSFGEKKYDAIVFAASIQYFPSLQAILDKGLGLLKPGGEIHLLDSWFYPEKVAGQAQQRSADYFRKTGFEKMSRYYYHHSLQAVKKFDPQVLYNPNALLKRPGHKKKPFYWLLIKSNT